MAVYFTITGTRYRHGKDFMERGMWVRLVKEPDNEHDREAIRVEMEGLGLVGYVANSPYTVQGESFSAGRLYDKIGEEAEGEILYVLDNGVLCRLLGEPEEFFGEDEEAECEEISGAEEIVDDADWCEDGWEAEDWCEEEWEGEGNENERNEGVQ